MGFDLERVVSNTLGRQAEDNYPQPAFWTAAGIEDRKHEGQHIVAMRDLRRQTEEQVGGHLSHMVTQLARLEADDRVVTELKFRLNRQHKLSQALDEDDPALKAKFAILDDDYFGRGRNQSLEWF